MNLKVLHTYHFLGIYHREFPIMRFIFKTALRIGTTTFQVHKNLSNNYA